MSLYDDAIYPNSAILKSPKSPQSPASRTLSQVDGGSANKTEEKKKGGIAGELKINLDIYDEVNSKAKNRYNDSKSHHRKRHSDLIIRNTLQ